MRARAVGKADPDGTGRLIGKTSIAPGGFGSSTRSVAASANFEDFYQIDPDLSIKKCGDRNPGPPEMRLEHTERRDQDPRGRLLANSAAAPDLFESPFL